MKFARHSVKTAKIVIGIGVSLVCTALRAEAAPVPAQRADDFVDRMGVATHWSYPDTPYGYAYERVKALLGELGLRHVRDGFHPHERDLFNAYGIKTTFLTGPDQGAQMLQTLRENADLADMIEGPNEVDIFQTSAQYKGKGFPEGPVLFQNELYAALKADPALRDLGVIAPSIARLESNLKLSPLRSFDYLVMHSYAGGQMPSVSLEGGTTSNLLNAARILGPGAALKPIVVTESGYHTALGNDAALGGAQSGISETAEAKYMPRHFAEYFNAGIARTFTYEFVNEFSNEQSNAEASFGIVRHDLTPKPAYTALKSLIALLSEAKWNAATKKWERPAFAPRALDYELSGDIKDVHSTLLQKADGDFYLLLWREVSSFDLAAKRDISNMPAQVTLKLRTPVLKAAAGLVRDEAPLKALSLADASVTKSIASKSGVSLRLAVPDEVMMVRVTPASPKDLRAPTAPAQTKATATGTALTLTWQPPRDPDVAGYFVSRLGRFLGNVTQPSFTDARLTPATGYAYEIRAYDGAGNISPPATLLAFTENQFPDLVVTQVTQIPANPRPGENVTFAATIKNVGSGPTPQDVTHGVAFFVDGTFVAWSDSFSGPLAPGAARTVTSNNGPQGKAFWVATAGTHTIKAQVDDVNRITESDETNNSAEGALAVTL